MRPAKRRSPIAISFWSFCACFLMAVGAYCLRWDPLYEALVPIAGILALLGGIALLIALYLNHAPTGETAASPSLRSTRPNYWLLIPGIAALVALTDMNTGYLGGEAVRQISLGVQLALLVLTIVLLTLGLGGWRWRREKSDLLTMIPREWVNHNRREWVLLAAITVLAFAVRAWNLELAVHKFVDELHFSSAVATLWMPDQHQALLAPFSSITAFPWLYPYIQSWFVTLGGRNLESLRWISVILGTLGIPALYFLAKVFFDRKTALIAALLLATFPPHIQYSRIGLNNIADPLFGTLAVAFLARGLKEGRRMDFAIGGAALGLTQYFYEGGRFLYPILIVAWLAWVLVICPMLGKLRRKSLPVSPQPSVHYSLLATFFLNAFLIGLPIYLTLAALNHPIDQRFQTVGVGGSYWFKVSSFGALQTFEQQILRPILIYVHYPETAQYYGGEQGLLLPYMVMFFLLGLFWVLWRWRALSIILLPWLILTSLGNMLLTDGAISARYVVTFPALILITAVGIRYVLPLVFTIVPYIADGSYFFSIPALSRFLPRSRSLLYLLPLIFAVAQVAYFFGPHLETYNRQLRPFYDSEDAIFRAASLPDETIVQIVSDYSLTEGYLAGIMGYLADDKVVKVLPKEGISLEYLKTLPRNVNLAFFIEPNDKVTLGYLKSLYDLQGPFSSPYPIDQPKQLLLYYVPDILHP